MGLSSRMLVALTAILICAPVGPGQEASARPKVTVEFRWLEAKLIPGVTTENSIITSETGDRAYPHKKPVLTNNDVAKVTSSSSNLGWMIYFHLKPEAQEKLANSLGERGAKSLSTTIDGMRWGSPYYRGQRDFAPFAGLLPQALAERVIAAFQP